MIKRIAALIGAIGFLTSVFVTPSAAFSVGAGVTGGGAYFEATGTETLRTSGTTQNAKEDATAVIGSVYIQALVGEEMFGEGNGFVIGFENFMGEGKFSGTSQEICDIRGSDTGACLTGNNYAEAVVDNFRTYYVESPTLLGIYLKAGISQMDVKSNEELATGGSYGNVGDVEGEMVGFGFRTPASGGFQVKSDFTYTDWDSLSVNNTADSTGTSTVSMQPEAWAARLSIGYNF